MKLTIFILTIFLISGCLKIKEIELSNNNIQVIPADENLSIFPANVDVIVTKIPRWNIELKDAEGKPVIGVTPQVDFVLSTYPRIFSPNTHFICTTSNDLGISSCESNKPSYVPSSLNLTVTVGSWSKNISLNVACPSDWSEVDIAQRITSPSSMIDTAEEFDLLRCNQPNQTYYIQETNFVNSFGYVFYPITLHHDVTIQFNGPLKKLTIYDDPNIYPEPPSLFRNHNELQAIERLTLKGLVLREFSYTSNRPKNNFAILAPFLRQSSIEDFGFINSSINLSIHAVGSSVAMFNSLEENTMISGAIFEEAKIISQSIDQGAFLSSELSDVSISNLGFKNTLIIGNFKGLSGLMASKLKPNNSQVSTFTNTTIFDSFILNRFQESTSYTGGLLGEIETGEKTRFHFFDGVEVRGLSILGPQSTVGSLFGKNSGSVRVSAADLIEIKVASRDFGGIFGDINTNNQINNIHDSKIEFDFRDVVSSWTWAQNHWNFQTSDYDINLDQQELESSMASVSGFANQIVLVDSHLELERTKIHLHSPSVSFSNGLTRGLSEDGINNFKIENFELVAYLKGVHSYALIEKIEGKAGGSFNMANSILRYPEIGENFKGAFEDFIFHPGQIAFSNIYVHYPEDQYDCLGDISTADPFLKCIANPNYDDFDVKYILNDSVFHTPGYNDQIFLDLNIWSPAVDDPLSYWQLK